MSLELDKRQRAMLREMGVQVWLPETPLADAPPAIKAVVAVAENPPETQVVTALTAAAPVALVRPSAPVVRIPPPVAPAGSAGGAPSWRLGEAQPLYAETVSATGARWLVLAEMPASTLAASRTSLPLVFDGDAGKLLDNMLRAARLHVAGAVLLAPVVRHAAAPPGEEFSATLATLIQQARPDIVLVMGRMASQALLASTEPLGRLRGRVQALHGARAVVTYDATYLLRAPADKAKAWDDLRLAMRLAATL